MLKRLSECRVNLIATLLLSWLIGGALTALAYVTLQCPITSLTTVGAAAVGHVAIKSLKKILCD